MLVEEHRLADGVGPDEALVVGRGPSGRQVLVGLPLASGRLDPRELGAGLEAAPTAHAFGERVRLLLLLRGDPWPRPMIEGIVDRHPGLDPLERMEQAPAIDDKITDDRELRHRPQFDAVGMLLEDPVDEGRTGHPRPPVDEHRARSTHLLEAVAVPGHGGHGPTILRARSRSDLLENADDVHVWLPGDVVTFPVALLPGGVLPQHPDRDRAGGRLAALVVVIGFHNHVDGSPSAVCRVGPSLCTPAPRPPPVRTGSPQPPDPPSPRARRGCSGHAAAPSTPPRSTRPQRGRRAWGAAG